MIHDSHENKYPSALTRIFRLVFSETDIFFFAAIANEYL
jgi:hypothetical protein